MYNVRRFWARIPWRYNINCPFIYRWHDWLPDNSKRDYTTLQNDLDKLSIWEQKWKMAFHPDTCNVLSIKWNKTLIKYAYTLHGHQLEHADKAEYLGVTIQSNLKWDSNINSITTKANKTFGFLRRNINISSTSVKEQAYKSLVQSITIRNTCVEWARLYTTKFKLKII